MRTNTRLIACYLIAMLLVNFHGNLMLTSQMMNREKPQRKLMFFWLLIRNVFLSFVKLVVAAFAFVLGAMMVVATCFFLWLCIFTYLIDGTCPLMEEIKGGGVLMLFGLSEVVDVKRVMWDDFWKDDIKYSNFFRRLELSPRKLTQGGQPQMNSDIENLDLGEFPEMTAAAIIQANASENFHTGRNLIAKVIKVAELKLQIRQKPTCVAGKTPVDPTCASLFQEAKNLYKESMIGKMALYRKRLRRIVVCTINMFSKEMDDELNPENYPASKKTEIENLKKIMAGKDAAAKVEAEKKLKVMIDQTKLSEDQKNKMSEKFGVKLIENGMNQNDAKSTYVNELITAGFAKFSAKKMEAVKKSKDFQEVLKTSKEDLKLGQIDEALKETSKSKLPDNLANIIDEVNEVSEDESNKTKEQL